MHHKINARTRMAVHTHTHTHTHTRTLQKLRNLSSICGVIVYVYIKNKDRNIGYIEDLNKRKLENVIV